LFVRDCGAMIFQYLFSNPKKCKINSPRCCMQRWLCNLFGITKQDFEHRVALYWLLGVKVFISRIGS
jgi:hypothetical protein